MHRTAFKIGSLFFQTYLTAGAGLIAEVGSYDRNGSLRGLCPEGYRYCGVDYEEGPGVDICMPVDDPLPFEDCTVDAVVCSSVLEHAEFFWELFLEMERILKPGGFLYINAPSNGSFHRYPIDCWRFFPDAGLALQAWGKKKGREITLIESFVGARGAGIWNDFVAVFQKLRRDDVSVTNFMYPCTEAWSIWRYDCLGIQCVKENQEFELLTQLELECNALREEKRSLVTRIAGLEARLAEEVVQQ